MDDFKLSNLSEAKNEYSIRLVNVLTPLIIEGIKSLFKEAKELCVKNNEYEKYLMTFQNFLSRVPKWNENLINSETNRIIQESQCSYLEDLLTCVHITQLKVLTSVRVGEKQKKIELDIPKLSVFIHRIYQSVSRKVYSNVYLFEENIMPLTYQKNMRELELIIKECILNTIRESIPVEQILRSYLDSTVEDEVVVKEEIIEEKDDDNVLSSKESQEANEKDKMEITNEESVNNDVSDNVDSETKIIKSDETIEERNEDDNNDDNNDSEIKKIISDDTNNTVIKVDTSSSNDNNVEDEFIEPSNEELNNIIVENLVNEDITENINNIEVGDTGNNEDNIKLVINRTDDMPIHDSVIDMNPSPSLPSNNEIVSENLQNSNNHDNDDNDDKIKIHTNDMNIPLDVESISTGIKLNDNPLLDDITVLPPL